jgi:hypothetical protein
MGLSTSTVLATAAGRGPARILPGEPFGPCTAVHAGSRNPDHPLSGYGLTGVRERVAVSGAGAP